MELLIGRNKASQRAKAVVFLCGENPCITQIESNATGGIKLQVLPTAGVIGIQNWVVDKVPAMNVHTRDWPKLRRDAFRLPVQCVDAEFEIQPIKELLGVSARTDK